MAKENFFIQNFDGASVMVDLRGSTKMIMEAQKNGQLNNYVEFMLSVQKFLYESLKTVGQKNQFYYNDTGDGFLLTFWGDQYCAKCLELSLLIYEFLEIEIPRFTEKNMDLSTKLDFGMGIHSGSIYCGQFLLNDGRYGRKFVYGASANSTARLESFSKNYIYEKVLISGDFRSELINQYDDADDEKFISIMEELKCLGEVDLKDSKDGGHWVYSLSNINIKELLEIFKKGEGG